MDFWALHGILFLLGLMFFPRITVWFFSAVTGGFIFWLFFLLMPRLFIAIIAIYNFWDTNPVLVVFGCLWCMAGEGGEKTAARKTAS